MVVDDETDMEDEYGDMNDSGLTYTTDELKLECGEKLIQPQLRYRSWGKLNEAKDNVIVVCHALTGNAALDDWWGSFLGKGLPFDTEKYFIVCSNLLGSCYGTTGPTSINPVTNEKYGSDFPHVTVRDGVRLQKLMLREQEGVESVKCVIGGSLGGMQTMEWLFDDNDNHHKEGDQPYVRSAIPMACGLYHHTWQIATSELQRQALYADPTFNNGKYKTIPKVGLSLARQIAMVSYRSHTAYDDKFGRRRINEVGREVNETEVPLNAKFSVENYLAYQGEKFVSRFDANSFITLTKLMDTHNIGRDRDGIDSAANSIKQPVHVIGIDSDVLYPICEQQDLAESLPRGELTIVRNDDGHDGFLLAQDAIAPIITQFLNEHN
jgi:homoserine O-acetyltransferase/O-succinyltransferase